MYIVREVYGFIKGLITGIILILCIFGVGCAYLTKKNTIDISPDMRITFSTKRPYGEYNHKKGDKTEPTNKVNFGFH